jgi:hypothetical protein
MAIIFGTNKGREAGDALSLSPSFAKLKPTSIYKNS